MQTSDRATVARDAYNDINERGLRAAAAGLWAPDIVFVDIVELPGGGEHHGREAALRHLEQFFESWAVAKLDVRDVVQAGDRVCVRFLVTAVGQASGVPTEWEHWHVSTFRGDEVARVEAYSTEDDALAALRGTSPS